MFRKILRYILKFFKWLLITIFTILLLVFVALNVPFTKKWIGTEVSNFLAKKLDTEVAIGQIGLNYKAELAIDDIFLNDLNNDTIADIEAIRVDFMIHKLIQGQLGIEDVELINATISLYRPPNDSAFNFSFIPEAFAPTDTTNQPVGDTATASSGGAPFHLENVYLNNVKLSFIDSLGGMSVNAELGELQATAELLDFTNQEVIIQKVGLYRAQWDFRQSKLTPTDTSSTEQAWNIGVNRLEIEEVKGVYQDDVGGMKFDSEIHHVSTDGVQIDLANTQFSVEKITLHKNRFGLVMYEGLAPKDTSTMAVEDSVAQDTAGFYAKLDKLDLKDNYFVYYDSTASDSALNALGFTAANFELDNITIDIEDVEADAVSREATINKFAIRLSDEFALKNFAGHFVQNDTLIEVTDGVLQTSNSEMKFAAKTQYKSFSSLTANPQGIELDQLQLNGFLSRHDIAYFVPLPNTIPDPLHRVNIGVDLRGDAENIDVNKFEIKAEDYLRIDITGDVGQAFDVEKLRYNLDINELMADVPALQRLLEQSTTNDVQLPNQVVFKGSVTGTANNVDADLGMNSGLGTAQIKATSSFRNAPESFDVDLRATNLALGEILSNKDLGKATFSLKAKGTGFDPKVMNGRLNFNLTKIRIKDYTYTDGKIVASIKNQKAEALIDIDEKHLSLAVTTNVDLKGTLVSSTYLNIREIDFRKLAVTDDTVSFKGKATIATRGSAIDDFSARIAFAEGIVRSNTERYKIAPSDISATLEKEATALSIESPVASVEFNSAFNVQRFGDVMQQEFSPYFDMNKRRDTIDKVESAQFDFTVSLKNEKIFEEVFVPGLEEIQINKFTGSYNSASHSLNVDIDVPHVVYDGVEVDSLYIKVDNKNESLNAQVNTAKLKYGSYTFMEPVITANAVDNDLTLSLSLSDEERKEKFSLEGMLSSLENGIKWQFTREGMMLYYEDWKVNPQNEILVIENEPIAINDLVLTNGRRKLAVNSLPNDMLGINFRDFTLESFTNIIFDDEQLISGEISGNAQLGMGEAFSVKSDLTIDHFAFGADTVGRVSVEAQSNGPDNYSGNFNISGNNKLQGNFEYGVKSENVDAEINFDKLDLGIVETYAGETLDQLEGNISGNIKVNGKTSDPNIKGALALKDVSFHLIPVGTTYSLKNSNLNFTQDRINFEKFVITDKDNNKAQVGGYVTLVDFLPDELNLNVNLNKFPLLQTKKDEDDEELVFGDLIVSTNLNITGTLDLPIVDGKVKLNSGTNLTVVLPEKQIREEKHKGVVEFVNLDSIDIDNEAALAQLRDTTSDVTGVELNAQIEVDPDVTLSLVIDPITGDYVQISGEAYLNFALARNGDMQLNGLYTVTDGFYQMTYNNLIKRRFGIVEGSSLRWLGEPSNPTLNLSASYQTRTSPLPLVQGQVQGAEMNTFKNNIDVEVILHITDEVVSPKIDYEIKVPENTASSFDGVVTAKINQINGNETSLTKQIFGLLVLNRFLPEEPGSNAGGGGGLNSSVRGSVSQLISDQFNNLAGKYIKSVDINFNLDSYNDYSSGEAEGRTELEIELSKSFFDDNLIVSVGNDINVEGGGEQQYVNDFVGDVRAEYLLTDDGAYRLKVYRENEYAGALDGELTKTGFSFIFTEEFKSLFGSKKKLNAEGTKGDEQ